MKEKIRFSELVEHVSSQAGVPKQFAHDYLKELSAVIEEGLLRDGSVSIYGFGNFKLQWVAPHMGHSPQTGAAMEISGRHKVLFRPHKRLRAYINRRYRRLSVEVLDETPHNKSASAPDELPPLDEYTGPLPRSSAAESIAATHTIAERIMPPPRPAALRERPAAGAAILRGSARDHADVGAQRAPGPRQPKALWIGVAAGVLALLVAVVLLLYPGGPPTPPSAERAPDAGSRSSQVSQAPVSRGTVTAEAAGGGREAVWTPQEARQAPVQPAARETQAAAQTSRVAAVSMQAAVSAAPAAEAPVVGTPGGVHSVLAGDSFWGISAARYRDPFLWPNIYRVNLQRISNPNVLRSGVEVTVPPLQGTADKLTAQDNRDVATGYLRAYQAYKRRGHVKAPYYLWVAETRDPQVVQQHAASIDAKDLAFVRKLNR